jgi:general L-amino acid transport system permease protein
MAVPTESHAAATAPALWRDVRFLQVVAQAAFVVLVFLAGRWLIGNLLETLSARGLDLSFTFLRRTAGFAIGEGLPMDRTDTFLRAFTVGLANSLRVIGVGLILTTILGVLSGIALLSPNWILRNVVRTYVEVIRNTPLLVQLFFLYFGIILKLPSLEDRITIGPILLSQRGVFLPQPVPAGSAGAWMAVSLACLALAVWVYIRGFRLRKRTGRETRPGLWAVAIGVGIPLILAGLLPQAPFYWEAPRLEGLRMVGGARLTPEFAGILFGLVIYTAAFIADVVRAGILAVPPGQIQAARSLGLTEPQVLRHVVLPQALRVVVPPLTNQYLNLAKNSSLAVGVGFPDLYSVTQTIFNQSGQAVQMIALMMTTYLALSLMISGVMNSVNRRLRIVER